MRIRRCFVPVVLEEGFFFGCCTRKSGKFEGGKRGGSASLEQEAPPVERVEGGPKRYFLDGPLISDKTLPQTPLGRRQAPTLLTLC